MRLIDRKIVLEDGSEYYGYGFGSYTDRVCEIVFNTSMVGYQEIVSDPSYTDQMVVMTYPLIGNYGITDDDFECKTRASAALSCMTTTICPRTSDTQRRSRSCSKRTAYPASPALTRESSPAAYATWAHAACS